MIEYFKNLYVNTKIDFYEYIKKRILENKKTFIVTANPETMMHGSRDPEYDAMLNDENTIITPDGIGVVKMAAKAGYPVKERITGVDITNELFSFGNEHSLTIYFYGSKPEVLDKLSELLSAEYKNLKIVGQKDGYSNNDDDVFEDIKQKKPDIVLIALGIPRQEILIYRHLAQFDKGIFMGIGGALDVLSGTKKRAPEFFIKLNCEWLYRLIKEPSRINRFYNNNVKFFKIAKKEIKKR